MFDMALFCKYYLAYAPYSKVIRLTYQNVGKIEGIPAIGGC